MPQVTDPAHFARAQRFKQVYARYQQARDLISVGAYVKGSDPETDYAIDHIDDMRAFLRQNLTESAPLTTSVEELAAVVPDNKPARSGKPE